MKKIFALLYKLHHKQAGCVFFVLNVSNNA